MTEEECEKLKAEYAKEEIPHFDLRLKDGSRVVCREFTISGGGGGGGGSGIGKPCEIWNFSGEGGFGGVGGK